jgi:hypothetical protein
MDYRGWAEPISSNFFGHCQLSVVGYQLSVVGGRWSGGRGQRLVGRNFPSTGTPPSAERLVGRGAGGEGLLRSAFYVLRFVSSLPPFPPGYFPRRIYTNVH